MNREYYAVRTGKESGTLKFDFDELKQAFTSTYHEFVGRGYFAEAYGQRCVDWEPTIGTMGPDIEVFFLRRLKIRSLWPIVENMDIYTEHDVFSVIELLYDHVSRPESVRYHEWNDCGNHYSDFDGEGGRREFREEINDLLRSYEHPYELSDQGEVLELPDSGLENLLEEPVPVFQPETVDDRIESAVRKFRRFSSSVDDRRDAVKTLADVLEYLRPQLQRVILKKDESDLFNIANKFAIRHHTPTQKADYDDGLWLKWVFYTYLATIHVVVGTLAKGNAEPK